MVTQIWLANIINSYGNDRHLSVTGVCVYAVKNIENGKGDTKNARILYSLR